MKYFYSSKLKLIFILLALVLIGTDLASSRRRIKLRNGIAFRRSAVTSVWPNAVIPYEFTANFTEEGRRNFALTQEKLAQKTCVRFRPRTDSDRYWLKIVYSQSGCSSLGGRFTPTWSNYDGQNLQLSDGCMGTSFFEHELGHALGFPHEQDRLDRDRYVEWDTSKPGCPRPNGQVPPQGGKAKMDQAALDILYDYTSIMHDWGECINVKLPGPITIGGSNPGGVNTYSVLDYEKINAIYDCGGCQAYRFRNIAHLAYNQYPVEVGTDLDRRTLYICRTYHNGDILIGKSKPDNDQCIIGADGKENEYKENFEVLTNPKRVNIKWNPRPNDFSIPTNAIIGGRTVTREPIFIGRCIVQQGDVQILTPGTLYKGDRELKVPYGGGMHTCTQYDILVCDQ